MRSLVAVLVLVCVVSYVAAGNGLYEPTKSPVGILNKGNFNTQIKKLGLEHVKIVEFYAPWCGHCKQFAPEWEQIAKEMKGIVKVYAVDCDDNAELCKEHDVSGFPTIKMFPPDLLGIEVYSGERQKKDIIKWATRRVGNLVTEVKSDTENAFLNKDKAMAKVLLFTDKEKTPLLYKGLSVEFKNKLMLGMVHSGDKALCSKYRVSKFPAIQVLIPGQKPLKYEGKMEFQPLFDFLNRYQETFAMKEEVEDEEATKPWLSQAIPELTSLSGDDVCFRFDGICVVAVTKANAEGKLDKSLQDTLVNVKAKFERQINRGTKFSFVWVNSAVESAFAAGVGHTDDATQPGFVALKLGKRNRYAPMEGEFSEDNINKFLDRVLGGDARYVNLQPIPALTPREKPGKK